MQESNIQKADPFFPLLKDTKSPKNKQQAIILLKNIQQQLQNDFQHLRKRIHQQKKQSILLNEQLYQQKNTNIQLLNQIHFKIKNIKFYEQQKHKKQLQTNNLLQKLDKINDKLDKNIQSIDKDQYVGKIPSIYIDLNEDKEMFTDISQQKIKVSQAIMQEQKECQKEIHKLKILVRLKQMDYQDTYAPVSSKKLTRSNRQKHN